MKIKTASIGAFFMLLVSLFFIIYVMGLLHYIEFGEEHIQIFLGSYLLYSYEDYGLYILGFILILMPVGMDVFLDNPIHENRYRKVALYSGSVLLFVIAFVYINSFDKTLCTLSIPSICQMTINTENVWLYSLVVVYKTLIVGMFIMSIVLLIDWFRNKENYKHWVVFVIFSVMLVIAGVVSLFFLDTLFAIIVLIGLLVITDGLVIYKFVKPIFTK